MHSNKTSGGQGIEIVGYVYIESEPTFDSENDSLDGPRDRGMSDTGREAEVVSLVYSYWGQGSPLGALGLSPFPVRGILHAHVYRRSTERGEEIPKRSDRVNYVERGVENGEKLQALLLLFFFFFLRFTDDPNNRLCKMTPTSTTIFVLIGMHHRHAAHTSCTCPQ